MSTIAACEAGHGETLAGAAPGFLGRLAEARERRAAGIVRQHLARVPDDLLARAGLDAGEITDLRATGRRRLGPGRR